MNPFLVRRSSIVASHREEKTSVYVPLLLSSTPLHSILPMSRAQFRQGASLRLRIAIVLFATRPDLVRLWLSWNRRVCSSRQKRRRNRNMGSSYVSTNLHRGGIRLSRGKQGRFLVASLIDARGQRCNMGPALSPQTSGSARIWSAAEGGCV